MGTRVLAVVKDGKIIGHTRWQTTADVLDTHGIYATSVEAADKTNFKNMSIRAVTDVIVTICEYDFDYENNTIKADEQSGWQVWANSELTAFSDCGFWDNRRDYGGGYSDDYGYTDVLEPDKYGKKYYEPIPIGH